jgi:glycosyltransferase involved in cell wall biosynthesis
VSHRAQSRIGPARHSEPYLGRTLTLVRLLRREQIDVLHVHTTGFGGLTALVAAILARVPAIVVTHPGWFGPQPSSPSTRLMLGLERRFARRVIALHAAQASDLEAAGVPSERISVIPFGVDPDLYKPCDGSCRLSQPDFHLIMVARMVEGKGHTQLLDAIAQLARRYPHLRVLLVGDGPLRPRIDAQIASLGLTGAVEVVGWLPNHRMPDMLRRAGIIALPSFMPGEVLPIALIEGMAMGLAAIGTRWAGIPDLIVDGENGMLVEPRDAPGLATAIERLITDPALTRAMGRQGRACVLARFSAERMAGSHLDVYRAVVARRRHI